MARLALSCFALALALTACEAAPVAGVFCSYPSDCRRPLTCRFDRCRSPCSLDADCPAGNTCLLDSRGEGTCGVSQDLDCAEGVGCDDALTCFEDRCLARCVDASDCPSDGACVPIPGTSRRVCVLASEAPDGGAPDAPP